MASITCSQARRVVSVQFKNSHTPNREKTFKPRYTNGLKTGNKHRFIEFSGPERSSFQDISEQRDLCVIARHAWGTQTLALLCQPLPCTHASQYRYYFRSSASHKTSMGPFSALLPQESCIGFMPLRRAWGLKEWLEWLQQPRLELCYSIVIFHRPASQEEMSSPKTKEAPLPAVRTGSKRIYRAIKSPLCRNVWVDGRGGRERRERI